MPDLAIQEAATFNFQAYKVGCYLAHCEASDDLDRINTFWDCVCKVSEVMPAHKLLSGLSALQ